MQLRTEADVAVDALRVDAGPAAPHGREVCTEDPLRPVEQFPGRFLAQREVERLPVRVGVPDGQPPVRTLDEQQLEVVLGRDPALLTELGQGCRLVGRVVAQRVRIGERRREGHGEGLRLEHLQPHAAQTGGE